MVQTPTQAPTDHSADHGAQTLGHVNGPTACSSPGCTGSARGSTAGTALPFYTVSHSTCCPTLQSTHPTPGLSSGDNARARRALFPQTPPPTENPTQLWDELGLTLMYTPQKHADTSAALSSESTDTTSNRGSQNSGRGCMGLVMAGNGARGHASELPRSDRSWRTLGNCGCNACTVTRTPAVHWTR